MQTVIQNVLLARNKNVLQREICFEIVDNANDNSKRVTGPTKMFWK